MPVSKVASALSALLLLGTRAPGTHAEPNHQHQLSNIYSHLAGVPFPMGIALASAPHDIDKRDLDDLVDLETRDVEEGLSLEPRGGKGGRMRFPGLQVPLSYAALQQRDLNDVVELLQRDLGEGDLDLLVPREARRGGGGFHLPSSRGSKLDFAGNLVGAAGNVAGALLTPSAAAPAPPVQKRGLDHDFDFKLLAREARRGGGLKLPSSRGSKLDFAGKAVGAAGDVAGALLTPGAQAPPPQQAVPMQRRDLGASNDVLVARSPRGGFGQSRGSKLDLAGHAIGAAGDVASALLTPAPAPMPMYKRDLDHDGFPLEGRAPRKAGGAGGHKFHHKSNGMGRGKAQINAAHQAAEDQAQQQGQQQQAGQQQ